MFTTLNCSVTALEFQMSDICMKFHHCHPPKNVKYSSAVKLQISADNSANKLYIRFGINSVP